MRKIDLDGVSALNLEPGHYKTLIERFLGQNEDMVREFLIPEVMSGETKDALKSATEIEQNNFWIEIFLEEMKDPQPEWEPTPANVDSACMSFRHDFGLMSDAQKEKLRWEATEWLRVWQKEGLKFIPTEEIE